MEMVSGQIKAPSDERSGVARVGETARMMAVESLVAGLRWRRSIKDVQAASEVKEY